MLHHIFESCKSHADVMEAEAKVLELMNSKKIKPEDLSILDIAESTLGRNGIRAMKQANDATCFRGVSEAVDAVNLSAFTNITGNLIFQAAVTAYESPQFIGSQLVTEEKATEDGGVDIGLAPIDDDAIIVKEGEEFSSVKFGEDYISIPTSVKRGLRIALTREMVFFDKTSKVIEMAQTVGDRVGTNKEVRILRTFLGIDNTFVRKGVARNTYVAAGAGEPRANKLGGTALQDWTDIDEALQLFANMNDDRTKNGGEPILVNPDTMVVAPARLFTARRVLGATEIRATTNTNNTTISNNVVPQMNVLSSPWVTKVLTTYGGISAANANDYWFLGQPKKAFKYRTLFPFQVLAAQHDKDSFERDVVAQFRADERGTPRIVAPWYNANLYQA